MAGAVHISSSAITLIGFWLFDVVAGRTIPNACDICHTPLVIHAGDPNVLTDWAIQ